MSDRDPQRQLEHAAPPASTGTERALGSAVLQLLTVPEVCELLHVSRWQVYRLMNTQQLKYVHINRRRLVPRVDLEAFVERLRAQGEVLA